MNTKLYTYMIVYNVFCLIFSLCLTLQSKKEMPLKMSSLHFEKQFLFTFECVVGWGWKSDFLPRSRLYHWKFFSRPFLGIYTYISAIYFNYWQISVLKSHLGIYLLISDILIRWAQNSFDQKISQFSNSSMLYLIQMYVHTQFLWNCILAFYTTYQIG